MYENTFAKKYQLDFPRECEICNKRIKSKSGLGSHLKNQHSISYKDYLKKYYNINLEQQIKDWELGKEKRKKEGHIKTGNKNAGKTPKMRMTPKQYNKWRNSLSNIFTLKWFQNKYGIEDGYKLYKNRSEEISKNSFFREYNKRVNKKNYSKISQKLFWDLYNSLSFKKIYFAELNHEYSCGNKSNYDFVILDNKKVIEFNGDMWHANPLLYESKDIVNPFTKETASKIWQKDYEKINYLKENGWKYKIIWESDYKKYPNKTFDECLKYLIGDQ